MHLIKKEAKKEGAKSRAIHKKMGKSDKKLFAGQPEDGSVKGQPKLPRK